MNDKISALSNLLSERVLPMFGASPADTHPWWWPLNHGADQSDWLPGVANAVIERQSGLLRGTLLRSLRVGPQPSRAPKKVDVAPWRAFEGFFGVGPQPATSIASLTEAPGTGPYPTTVIATMMRRLDELGLKGAHFTNLVKRRGGAPGDEGLQAHIDVLVEELAIVGRGSERLIICPNRMLARSSEGQLLDVRGMIAARIPDCKVVLLLGDAAPLALYSAHAQVPGEVLASWRAVLAG